MEDSGIKLFGKKILLPENSKSIDLKLISGAGKEPSGGDDDDSSGLVKTCLEGSRVNKEDEVKDQLKAKHSEIKAESDNPKTPSIHEENVNEKPENEPKTLKKPDKILPCPRCTSMDTKFCYFNNYNVNQPRHFCKSCQRYWTAGGAMRNMPIGAGRRKNKNPATHCRYVTISQETFRSTASVSGGSTVTTSDSVAGNGFNSKVNCNTPVVSWSFSPRNSALPIPIPIPAVCPPLPVYPSSYWNCIPFLPPLTPQPAESILGKHSRNGFLLKPNDSDQELKKPKNSSVLIPKTLRINDHDEAAKSSIWATLGIKGENFKAFQEKGEEAKKRPATITSPVLEANPAALSRSLCFQESA